MKVLFHISLVADARIAGNCVGGVQNILHASDAIPGYAGISYKAYMEENFHLPCAVENDVNCAGLAESISGAGKGSRINLCLTVGTGIGGCLVVDGKVFHGASNSACEVGYMHLAPGAFQD